MRRSFVARNLYVLIASRKYFVDLHNEIKIFSRLWGGWSCAEAWWDSYLKTCAKLIILTKCVNFRLLFKDRNNLNHKIWYFWGFRVLERCFRVLDRCFRVLERCFRVLERRFRVLAIRKSMPSAFPHSEMDAGCVLALWNGGCNEFKINSLQPARFFSQF